MPLQWREMTETDLSAVDAIAAVVHPDFPEDPDIFAERLQLFREGCHVLDDGAALAGYIFSHPWRLGEPPALNRKLGNLPTPASTYYIHDLALMPRARGAAHGTGITEQLAHLASSRQFTSLSLVAVNGSTPFWQRHGFVPLADAGLAAKLASYGDDAAYMIRHLD